MSFGGQQVQQVKKVGETADVLFDFSGKVPAGGSISSATVTAAVYSGVDANPSALISGADSISGAIVTQELTAGVAGVIYELTCEALLSDGQTLRMSSYLAVVTGLT